MDKELEKELAEFFRWFEEVFHRDWPYTKCMLGMREPTEEDRKQLEAIFGSTFGPIEFQPTVSPNGTFLKPGVEDPGEDWGHRGLLLASYQRLLPLLKKHGIVTDHSSENHEQA